MSMAPFLLLAAAAKNSQKRRTNTRKSTEKRGSDKVYNYAPKTYSVYEHIHLLCYEDERLRNFFINLNEEGKKIDTNDEQIMIDEFINISNKYFKLDEEIQTKLEELKSLGVELTHEFKTRSHFYPVKGDFSGFHNCGIGYNREKTFSCGFEGIALDKNMLLDNSRNIYQEAYDLWEQENKNIFEEEKQLINLISENRKKLKWSVFNRKEIEEELIILEQKLNNVRANIEEGRRKKKDAETFNSIDENKRKKLLEYFNLVAECENIGDQIKEIINNVIAIGKEYYGNTSRKDRKKWERALENLLKDDNLKMKEELEYVELTFFKKLCEKNFKYETGLDSYHPSGISREMRLGINWFLNGVYSKYEEEITKPNQEINNSSKKI